VHDVDMDKAYRPPSRLAESGWDDFPVSDYLLGLDQCCYMGMMVFFVPRVSGTSACLQVCRFSEEVSGKAWSEIMMARGGAEQDTRRILPQWELLSRRTSRPTNAHVVLSNGTPSLCPSGADADHGLCVACQL